MVTGYFFRLRITRIAPETNANALDALPALISGAVTMSAKAKPETPTRSSNIPTALSIVYPPFSFVSVRSSTNYLGLKNKVNRYKNQVKCMM
jgi:hypothetical protein